MATRKQNRRLGQREKKNSGGGMFIVLAILLGLGGLVLFHPSFEREAPMLELDLPGNQIGLAAVPLQIRDTGSGLDSVRVTLQVGDTELELFNERYASPVQERVLSLDLAPLKKKLHEGPALLTVSARDRSLWLLGNTASLQRTLQVDLSPPAISILSTDHYVTQGGSGVVIYSVSEEGTTNGVQVGDYFFPGTPGLFREDPRIQVAIFAHPHDVPRDVKAQVRASDAAGNATAASFPYVVRDRRYRERTINVSESFIRNVVLPLQGRGGDDDLVASFLRVNNKMRADNARQKREICSTPSAEILWDGAFHQLSNSKVEANFADKRDYLFDGKKVDQQYHLGYDLAVTKRYPIEAANNGRVVWAEPLGIYGNTVILDHGLGVYTLYAHLSSMDVKAGDTIQKRAVLGRSGSTGLAGGDHLHYEVMIRGVPVLPLEWWDRKWIQDNVERKLDAVRKELASR
ncbi:MAG: M23 family metallopeptidase [Gammaproteobacteria bacterium]|nr:M23 family metallopeptidase [Gammaproteobacteria bacterium]